MTLDRRVQSATDRVSQLQQKCKYPSWFECTKQKFFPLRLRQLSGIVSARFSRFRSGPKMADER